MNTRPPHRTSGRTPARPDPGGHPHPATGPALGPRTTGRAPGPRITAVRRSKEKQW
ncbi:hypothetical protein SLNWT_6530 [Streptomyces albus]|uniref:Uncharacterized protein n=1 Tax=Streptomyces albus (strain ATCC 21838 / DSM 41398 / FERM P-419 / JCM 4703 / NBRC 107858) TaxID=1081613 RepID=A0A0B5F7V7_STRA4|nr:hypothetical protein SLNWT_6530 [Streptomyces albus]AOU81211.1 hypothetical protein SLNHY_6520 [Streptomyces albus]AYN36906.1 hypothetical protein DUI70_6413 [Streptomyces albus]